MPTPPEPGCYAIKSARDRAAYIVQFAEDGRMVECLGPVALERPPKRRAVRYLGPSYAEVLAEGERRRELAMARALVELWSPTKEDG